MKKSKVFFIEAKDDKDIPCINAKVKTLLVQSKILDNIQKADKVAVKLHFGEEGNKGYINPLYLRTIVEAIKYKNTDVFLTDTNALYKGRRTNSTDHLKLAAEHGFSPDKIGAQVVIADGNSGEAFEEVKINSEFVKVAYVAKKIREASSIVAVSHFKGHLMTGFGGALKNLGMGCAARRGKLVQHGGMSPIVRPQKCISCENCIGVCPVTAIKMVSNKAVIYPKICIGCATCIAICPAVAIDVQWEMGADTINEKMAEYAKAALIGKEGKCVFINFAIKITKECDCLAKDDPKICPDIGIFVSFDPVAIDQACLDKALEAAGKDVFREAHPDRDCSKQLIHAEKIGVGSREYELVKL